jgi:hypothetical protein
VLIRLYFCYMMFIQSMTEHQTGVSDAIGVI